MAPEIIRGEAYGSAVDIWAVGVIACILLTGKPPFYGKSKRAIFQQILNFKPVYAIPLPQYAEKFISWCLEKDAKNRPTADALLKSTFL